MTGHFLVALCLLVATASALPGGLLPKREPWLVAEEPSTETESPETPSTETPYTKPTEIPPTMPATCAERPDKNDYLMITHPLTCTRFIVCDGPRETVMSCPDGLYFNYVEQYCDWPWLSNCEARPGLPSTTTEYFTDVTDSDVTDSDVTDADVTDADVTVTPVPEDEE